MLQYFTIDLDQFPGVPHHTNEGLKTIAKAPYGLEKFSLHIPFLLDTNRNLFILDRIERRTTNFFVKILFPRKLKHHLRVNFQRHIAKVV